MVDVLRSRVRGPLEPYAPGFAAELSQLGYTANSAAAQVGVVAHLSRWMAGEQMDAAGLSELVVQRYMAVSPRGWLHELSDSEGVWVHCWAICVVWGWGRHRRRLRC